MLETMALMPQNFSLPDAIWRLLISTGLLLLAIVILRTLTARFIRRHVTSSELRGRLLMNFRNGFLLLGILGLALIWGDQIRSLALSIVAIAVAFVVATKELILCISGAILKSGAGSFNLGDRIQVKDFPGDVIDQTLLAAANRHCEPYLESVRKYMNKVGVSRGLEVPSVDPRVTIQVPVASEIHLTVRLPAKPGQRSYIEQAILSEVFADTDYSTKKP